MLIIWCAAETRKITDIIGPVISRNSVQHKVVSSMNTIPHCAEGDVILACGSKALAILQATGLVPKGRTVTSVREHPIPYNGANILTTFDPGLALMDYARLPEVQWDVQLSIRLHNNGTIMPVMGEYKYVDSLIEFMSMVEERYAKTHEPVEVAYDLETKGLDELHPNGFIVSASFTIEAGMAHVLYFEQGETLSEVAEGLQTKWQVLWQQVQWLLNTEKISLRGANLKYDCRWTAAHWGIEITNFKLDTLLVGSLLDENRSNSLKLHAKLFTQLGGYEAGLDQYDMARMDLVPKETLLAYTGGDTDSTWQVAKVFKRELVKDKALTNFYVNLLHPASRAFEKMERGGVVVDLHYLTKLEAELRKEAFDLSNKMLMELPHKLRIKYMDSIREAMEQGKSPLKPALLKEFLFSPRGLNLKPQVFTEKTGEPSTAADHLMMFASDPIAVNFISAFREYGVISKMLSTFIVGFLKHIRIDGRFHPTYMLFRGGYGSDDDDAGTNTGRTSAKDPAIQTLTKHGKWAKRLRRAYTAPPGYTILQLDYSQGELRITAVIAEEPVMIQAYRDGLDLHAITAAQLNGYSFEDFMLLPEDVRDELRSGGKAGNFGLIYGMQHRGFREYAFTTYGVIMTEEDAFQKRETFFELYNQLPVWHERYKAFAHQHGFVRSPLGRVRHLPMINSRDRELRSQAERQCINSPVQSCLSDMMQLAMVHILREYPHADIHMALMTHDSLALYVPEQDAVEWARRIKLIMENLPLEKQFGFVSPLKFLADAEAAVPDEDGIMSLASLKKLKGL